MPSYSQGQEHTVAKVIASVNRSRENQSQPFLATLLMRPSSRAIAFAIVGLAYPTELNTKLVVTLSLEQL
jgi:hypothetical protein